VVYLRPLLDELVGAGRARVILPITDPYVVHHGALGSFATIYFDDAPRAKTVAARLAATPGIAEVYDNATGCARFELPRDRVGDLIVIGDIHTVLGNRPRSTISRCSRSRSARTAGCRSRWCRSSSIDRSTTHTRGDWPEPAIYETSTCSTTSSTG
jgi:phosphonoacetate hydrolase